MENTISDPEKFHHLMDVIKHFDTAMLATRRADGSIHSRPLAIAEVEDEGTLRFATRNDSPKVAEATADWHVNVTMQQASRFVSVTGLATLESDRALIDRLWSESWKVWFPMGKTDPSLSILTVRPTEAEYWDGSGIQGLKYLFDAARAFVTGQTPGRDHDERQNARVKL